MVGQLSADLVQGQCGDNVIYQWNTETGSLVISGSGPMYDYASIEERPWHGPSPSNFTSIVIKDGVTHIGDRAFWGFYGFGGNLTIPASVTSIGEEAFYNCNYLTTLVMGSSVVSIGNYAFLGCERIESELKLPDCLESIGDGAFHNCKKLKGDLVIPNSVKTVGEDAFSSCEGFTGTLHLGSSLETIGQYAFSNLNVTGNLTIPENVTNIGSSAFDNCKYLVGNVTVPKGVTTIEQCVFRSCSGITGITLLGQVTHIRNSAFNGCSSLTDFVCYATTPPNATEYGVFDNMPLKTVYVPAESVDLYKEATVWKDFEILPIGGSGIENASNENKLHITLHEDKLSIHTEDGSLERIALFGINGLEVLSDRSESSSIELDLSSIPSGIYIVKVVTGSGEYCRKIIW